LEELRTRGPCRRAELSQEIGMATDEREDDMAGPQAARQSAAPLLGKDQFLQLIINSTMEAVITMDGNHRITIFNPAAEKMFGVAAAEAIGSPLDRFIPPRYRAEHRAHVDSFVHQSQTRRKMGEFGGVFGLRADGTEFPIEASISKFESGGQKLFTVMLRDATETTQAREMQARLAAIVQSSDDAIIGETLDGIITSWNRAAERIFGYSPTEAIGRPLGILYADSRSNEEQQILNRIARGEPVERFEAVRVRKDGKPIYVSLTFSAIHDTLGKIVGASKIARDITESKRAEAEIRQQAALLDLAQVLVRDIEGRILYWSHGAQRMYGYTKQEAVAQISHELLQTEFPQPLKEIEHKLQLLGVWEGELVHRAKDGKRVVAASQWVLYRDAQGTPIRILEALADITESKRAELQLLRSQKLEALGTLSGGIAHDFNNILSAINGNVSLAASELPHEHPVQEFLGEVQKAGARATDLVRRILSFSRPLEQKREIRPLQPVVEEALRLVRATLPAMVEIHTSFAADLPSVNVDATQIHQVIVNLATNSGHAIGDRAGRIDVRLDAREVREEDLTGNTELQAGRYVRLYVGDDGCGMEAATLARIFDPFFTTKPTGQGTGLGLSVVHGIVSSHGGAVTVYSQPGKGTAFHLYFPAIAAVAELAKPKREEVQQGTGQRLLYLDDEEALVSLGKRRLERLGYRVTGFTDPRAALEEFRRRPGDFDAVITDVSMPQMTGFDFARGLLELRPEMPIVVTSGYVRPEDQAKAEELGVRELILKPAPIEDLARILGQIFQAMGQPVKAPSR
jgi:PAS domain S-box-containing protein